MGDGRDVGRKYVGGIGCGSVWRLGRGEVAWLGAWGMCRVVFLFCFWVLGGLSYSWSDSSLRCVVCVCVLVVVDWFCLSFFFGVTLVSLFDGVSCV